MVKGAVAVIRKLSPLLKVDIHSNRPHFCSFLASAAQVINASLPGNQIPLPKEPIVSCTPFSFFLCVFGCVCLCVSVLLTCTMDCEIAYLWNKHLCIQNRPKKKITNEYKNKKNERICLYFKNKNGNFFLFDRTKKTDSSFFLLAFVQMHHKNKDCRYFKHTHTTHTHTDIQKKTIQKKKSKK